MDRRRCEEGGDGFSQSGVLEGPADPVGIIAPNGELAVEVFDADVNVVEADGLSRGWFEDGQPEIEETFLDGVSNGVRTRWYPGGTKKSTATIRDGVIVGSYVTWHDNGQKAAEVDMVDGQPHGLAEAWHPNGRLKSRVQLDHGVPSHTEFFPETGAIAGADNPPTAR